MTKGDKILASLVIPGLTRNPVVINQFNFWILNQVQDDRRGYMDERQHDINNNRLYAAISYLWILCFVPILWRRRSEFAMHHVKQGLVLLIAEFLNALIGWTPFAGYYISMIGGLALALLAFLGIINALNGKYWEMPVLGRYAKKIKI